LLLPNLVLLAEPAARDVFREYRWKPEGRYHVLNFDQHAIEMPGELDLADAINAEVVLEIGNAHLGYEDMGIQVNGREWKPIKFPPLSPADPSPSVWFHQWFPTLPFAVSDFKQGAGNTFTLRIGPKTFDGMWPNYGAPNPHPAHTCIYGVTFRIYYDPAKKVHPSGKVVSPRAGAKLGRSVELAAAAKSHNSPIRQIDFIGQYEDINYQGGGVYEQWHYHFIGGKITDHLGSADAPGKKVVWNTSWVPDQKKPTQIAARITDSTGLIYMTDAVSRLSLVRPGLSVELCKPYDIPKAFTSCQYGIYIGTGPQAEKFDVKGDLSKILDAKFAISCWNGPAGHGFTVNGVTLADAKIEGYEGTYHLFVEPLRPLTALKPGTNVFATIPGPKRSSDIHWPGVAVLIQYRK
jgi:hypothetical protein